METTNPAEFDDKYDEYNDWYKKSLYAGVGMAVIYIALQTDFHLSWKQATIQLSTISTPVGEIPALGMNYHLPVKGSH